jgi:hypothetical protein
MQSISAANGREVIRKKRKRRLIIVDIFVIVVVLEAVGWICMCYAYPVLDRFLPKIQF